MKTPLNWLKKYVDIDVPLDELCNKMVMCGFEVESIEDLPKKMDRVVVGIILSIEKHPDADKLTVCQVDVGEDSPIQIVTGASNIFEGAMVPVALDNSCLPGAVKIKKGKLRGVLSEGMMCSGEELELKEADYPGAGAHGILILKEDCPAGADMREILGLNDIIIDFDVTANRPDCNSILGIAREVAAVLGKKIKMPEISYNTKGADIKEEISVNVEDFDLCPRYYGAVVKNIRIAQSPKWMRDCLNAAGMRPIDNIVDITNFVMLETGQPMHAFDMRKVGGRQIIVRRAKNGEKIQTLDEKTYKLENDMLVIADANGPSCLAGIMGSISSEIKEDTSEVFFEAAKFRRDSVRRTARNLGIRTEASARFQKGIDIASCEYAMKRALTLIDQLDAGDIVEGVIDCNEGLPQPRVISASVESINKLLGLEIPGEKMAEILCNLSIETKLENGVLKSQIPSFREDIEGTADIAEEVIRKYGYEHINGKPLVGQAMRGRKLFTRPDDDKVKSRLITKGLREIETYSFISASASDMLYLDSEDPRRIAVPILNPLSEEYAVLRTQLVSSMLKVLQTNYSRKNPNVGLFELGKRFIPHALPVTQQPDEIPTMSIGMYGEGVDFFKLKGILEDLFAGFKVEPDYEAYKENFLHPGRSAAALLKGKTLAIFGELHPKVASDYDFDTRVYVAQVYLDVLYELADRSIDLFTALPKFPAVERDLALICDEEVPAASLEKVIRAHSGQYLEKLKLFDVYQGAQIEKGKKSIAYSLIFRSPKGTMKDEEINGIIGKIMSELELIGVKLRS